MKEKECKQLIREIENQLDTYKDSNQFQELQKSTHGAVEYVMRLSLSDEKRARASQTWGKRKQLLETIKKILTNQDINSIIGKIDAINESGKACYSMRR